MNVADQSLVQYKKMYDRSSSLAKLGVWECVLSTSELTWTDGVYDIFELPRGSAVTREMILDFYYRDSLAEMSRRRAAAIAARGTFDLDIRIRTAKGNKRWVRLLGDVECENGVPVRIFGVKQDITKEKALWDQLRFLAERDPLTSIANRSVFQAILAASLIPRPSPQALAALVLLDLDGFKAINDSLGHAAGDECLKETAKRLRRVFRDERSVARIGGDEFAIVICGSPDRAKIEAKVRRVIDDIRQPISWKGVSFAVGISCGISMPDDPGAYDQSRAFQEADLALYAAKRAGRNTYRIFDASHHSRPPRDSFRRAGDVKPAVKQNMGFMDGTSRELVS